MKEIVALSLSVLIGATLSVVGTGCLSIYAQHEYWSESGACFEGSPTGMVYTGVLGDVSLLVKGGPCGPNVATVLIGILDFPLSLAMDTAILPLTIGESIQLAMAPRKGCSTQDCPAEKGADSPLSGPAPPPAPR
jgi:hypothetical protein